MKSAIELILKPVIENENNVVLSHKISHRSKIVTITFVIEETWKLNYIVNKEFKKLVLSYINPLINVYIASTYQIGKKTENIAYYSFTFSIKKEFWDNTFDDKHLHGIMFNFVNKFSIKSIHDFYTNTIDMVDNMRKYTHDTTLNYKEKRKLNDIKLLYIKELYNLGFIESVYKQISYRNDNLILFNTNIKKQDGTYYNFHLRYDDVNFLLYKEDLELLPHLYLKKEFNNDEIDLTFFEFLPLIRKDEKRFLFHHAEIK